MTADGNEVGLGKMIGMVFYEDYGQSETFELGEKGSFVGLGEGQLFVRCRDGWSEISDNEGEIVLHIRRTPKDD